jgi:hypothetical protein
MEAQIAKTTSDIDRLRTFKDAAEKLGIPYFKVQRAARRGLIPTYSLVNTRKYVRLRDILHAMCGSSEPHRHYGSSQ